MGMRLIRSLLEMYTQRGGSSLSLISRLWNATITSTWIGSQYVVTSSKSFLEETNTFHNSLPEFENFYFDSKEISSGSTTTHSDISLSDYEAFYFDDDHIEKISSGGTTTHFDISLSEYDSFIFDFAHEEFADELAHIISPPNIPGNLKTLVKGFYPPSLHFLSFNWES
nr:hypothetical protein [Tanacetum cinerariifolium]